MVNKTQKRPQQTGTVTRVQTGLECPIGKEQPVVGYIPILASTDIEMVYMSGGRLDLDQGLANIFQ